MKIKMRLLLKKRSKSQKNEKTPDKKNHFITVKMLKKGKNGDKL